MRAVAMDLPSLRAPSFSRARSRLDFEQVDLEFERRARRGERADLHLADLRRHQRAGAGRGQRFARQLHREPGERIEQQRAGEHRPARKVIGEVGRCRLLARNLQRGAQALAGVHVRDRSIAAPARR